VDIQLVQVRPILGAIWPGEISWASVQPLEDSGPTGHKGTIWASNGN